MFSASIFLVCEAPLQDWLYGEHGQNISSGQTLGCPEVFELVLCPLFIKVECSWDTSRKKGILFHRIVRGPVCHVKPPYAVPVMTAVPVWLPTSKLLAFLNMHSEFYFPVLQTVQFPKSTKGQAFIPGLKEYALGSFSFLFSFGEVIKTALIISKQPTFS